MDYIGVKQAAQQWGLTERRVRILCQQNRIPGIKRDGRSYLIPYDAVKPADGRGLRGLKMQADHREQLIRIDGFKEELQRRRPLSPGELRQLSEQFLIEFTYNSNAIEGNTLTLQETALVLAGVTIDQKPLRDHLEAVGHRDAFEFLADFISETAPVTETLIKQVHSLVLMDQPEDRGVYRRIPVRIMGAAQEPPQPYLVPVQMEGLIADFSKSRQHPIEQAVLFHLRFEGIHPFIDGNGRTGRLLMNFMLMKAGYPPINVKFTDRRKYYNCFDDYYKEGNATPLFQLIADYVEERLREYLTFTK